jgi:acetylornithine deacetylase
MDEKARSEIVRWVDERQAELIDLARALISYRSENRQPYGEEGPCQRYVADVMRDMGCRVDTFTPPEVRGLVEHPDYWPGRDYTNRPNVVGVLSPSEEGPVGKASGRPSMLFTGHVDVVPAIGQGRFGFWDGAVADGELYGRGSNDMKGGIAAYLMAARCIRELAIPLRGDLLMETVVDEEFGGANGTLACRLRGYNADLALLPEPNNMVISPAHRGGQQFRIYMEAKGAGMAFGEAVLPDPVTALGHALAALDRYNEARHERPRPAGFETDTFPIMPFALRAGELLPWGTGESIPETAWVEFWIEIPPGVTQVELQGELKAAVADAAATTPTLQRVSTRWEERTRFLPGSSMPTHHPALAALARNLEAVSGLPPAIGPAPFACDGFVFNLLSPTPVALLGPRGTNAHAPDERVVIADLVTLAKVYALTASEWLG